MKLPIVFMFSGQGSQYYQMGKGLFDNNKTFKHWMLKGDKYCQDWLGHSVIAELYDSKNSKSQPFMQTGWTHPAIFMIQYALFQVMLENDIKPDYVLGASLGEVVAAAVAEVLDFDSAMYMVCTKARTLDLCPEGGMLAILHNQLLYKETILQEKCEVAAINFATHFVVSGLTDNLNLVLQYLNEKNIPAQRLPVLKPFHSSYIEPAKIPFLEALTSIKLYKPAIRYISSVAGMQLENLSKLHFWEIARKVILFQETIHYMESLRPALYIDLGPSGTLATFVKYNLGNQSSSKTIAMLTPFGDENKIFPIALTEVKNLI